MAKKTKKTEEITKNDFFELGLTGRDNSKANREKVLKYLNLPTYLTTNAMISALNVLVTKDEIKEIFAHKILKIIQTLEEKGVQITEKNVTM